MNQLPKNPALGKNLPLPDLFAQKDPGLTLSTTLTPVPDQAAILSILNPPFNAAPSITPARAADL